MRLKEFQRKITEMLSEHPDIEDVYVEHPTSSWYDWSFSLAPVSKISYCGECLVKEDEFYYDKDDWMERCGSSFESEEEAQELCDSFDWRPAIIIEV